MKNETKVLDKVTDEHKPEFLPTDKDKSDRNKPYRRTCLTCQLNDDGRCKLQNTFLTDHDLEHKHCRLFKELKGLKGGYVDEESFHQLNKQVINAGKHPMVIKKI